MKKSYFIKFQSKLVDSLAEPSLVICGDGILDPESTLLQQHVSLDGKMDLHYVLKPWGWAWQNKSCD